MFTTPEQFAAANKASVDAMLTLANTALASAERIAALNLNTAKTRVTASVSRELVSYQTLYSSYYQNDRFVISPYWQISAKTGLRLRYDYSERDYLGAIAATSFNGRTDTIKLGSIAFEWAPYSNTLISASLQNEKRSSNKPGQDYDSTMGTVSAQITF